ncbi:MAG: hypothetical protein JSS83_00605 [Cyanobacteria bacterium SZAS LIN-3]|nr:hypothetical protein [Cyanobacteria bacterium SZAS LIN-3]
MESSLFGGPEKYSPSAEQAAVAAAVLGTAALVIATRGREIGAMATAVQETGWLPKFSGRLLSAAAKKDSNAIFMEAEGHVTSTAVKTESAGIPFSRSAADQAKHEEADRMREIAYKASDRDAVAREKASATLKAMEERGETAMHPVTGQPLTPNERYYNAYIDALPRPKTVEFAEDGKLMPGIYRMSFQDFKAQFGIGERRERLLGNFEQALRALKVAGVEEVHVGGSFVTKKVAPHDIDFLWDVNGKPFDREVLRWHDYGALLQHDSGALKNKGLQMMITPPENGTYKGMQNFFAHERMSWPMRRRGVWSTGGMNIPKGLVELDLKTLPKWLPEGA